MDLERAVFRQREVWKLVESKLWNYSEDGNPRFASLHEDYYESNRLDMGHSVNIFTEELCKGEFQWDETGSVLLCTTCFADGT